VVLQTYVFVCVCCASSSFVGILFSRFVAVVVCAKDLDAALLRAQGRSYEFRVVVKTKPDGKDVLSCCVRTSNFCAV
jgi:hypothetical protein